MNKLLNSIFSESIHDFRKIPNENDFTYYASGKDNQHYFTLSLEYSEVAEINSATFDELEKYKTLKKYFEYVSESISNTVEKNSSLIITIRLNSFTEYANIQQQILLMEEDEYYFKKYVIVYTDDSTAGLDFTTITSKIEELLLNEELFQKYYEQGFDYDNVIYLLVVQLFIKIPFLKLHFGEENFKSLEDKINDNLSVKEKKNLEYFIENVQKITDLDFEDLTIENDLNVLLKAISDD